MYDDLITIPWKLERDAPPFEGNDIKSPEGLYRHIYNKYSKRGDTIFDPFAGMGTSLFVAEEMNRVYYGIEAEEEKYEWVAGQLEHWTHLINDDAARMDKYKLPKMDLIVTSPPFMEAHTKWNPLYGGDPKFSGYDKYLKRMAFIFGKCHKLMKKDTPLIIQLDNIKNGKKFTPLISDISNTLKKNFIQIEQITVVFKNAKENYSNTQYLVFNKQ